MTELKMNALFTRCRDANAAYVAAVEADAGAERQAILLKISNHYLDEIRAAGLVSEYRAYCKL